MPKIKSHSGTKDRIRVTKKGRVMARKSYGNHNLEKKTPGRKRTFKRFNPIEGKVKKNIRRSLGI